MGLSLTTKLVLMVSRKKGVGEKEMTKKRMISNIWEGFGCKDEVQLSWQLILVEDKHWTPPLCFVRIEFEIDFIFSLVWSTLYQLKPDICKHLDLASL